MITADNFKELLRALRFEENNHIFTKHFPTGDFELKVDFKEKQLAYPEAKGLIINERQTCNFEANENFVVFECVHRLLEKGYLPESIELEPKWKLGRGASGGRADILVKNQENKPLLLVECKTAGKEFEKAWREMQQDGGQLFSYAQQISETQFLCLYASDFDAEESQDVVLHQRIISHRDNKDILEQDDSLPSFAQAQSLKERFEVWKNTYQLEYTEKGIFEENIQTYQIGKDNYTLDIDTKPINFQDKNTKYHTFRTILRQYNVSRRENAFEVLLNLFLCKIVDEKENPQNLKFYWKGIAYDNYYDLVDRLQGLYQIGMKRFLDEDIVYVSNEQIDDAFWTVKGSKHEKADATKKEIKRIFRQLKFFKGLDFEFIKVHNADGFNKNAKILLDIIKMWQGARLKTDLQNQYLGDMFEHFLDNGIKQTEGQFFTPIPICKFIVASLPLQEAIVGKAEPLKAIDYACGAGHFLNEYALQIKPIVEKHKQTPITDYYKNIFGIEKEDRLAKVAKVSAFMYGQDEINIIDADALVPHAKIENETFDVLVANPPFAVKDFLMTIEPKDRQLFSLFKEGETNTETNNIQCFFLERAKQLLAPEGIAGIIVPTSVLANGDNTHIETREILLKYFDIISLVELGSGTFGQTGTNTVVLFLRRKAERPEQAEHFWNRVQAYFENGAEEIETAGGVYQDLHLLKKYCQHIDIPFEAYKHLITTQRLDDLWQYDIFKEYKEDFDKNNDIKKLRENKHFKAKTPEAQAMELHRKLLKHIYEIEMQKLYYFILAYQNPQKVLVIKSPTDNKDRKGFLGYEWSGAKGTEGIKYNGGSTVHDIITPMFNPQDAQDQTKLSYYIAQNFLQQTPNLPTDLQPYASYANLADLLDFSRKEFNKAISLTPKKDSPTIETKWEMVKLGNVCQVLIGGTPSRNEQKYFKGSHLWVSIAEMSGQVITDTKEKITDEGVQKSNVKLISQGTTLLSFKLSIGKTAIAGKDLYTNEAIAGLVPYDKNQVLDAYLFQLFTSKLIDLESIDAKVFGKSLNSAYLRDEVKIPLPPLDVQARIVGECEAIDSEAEQAGKDIARLSKEIEEKITATVGKYPERKIAEIAIINPSKSEIKNIDDNTVVSFVEMASVSDEGFIASKMDKPLNDLRKGGYTYFAENDIIVAKITPCMENGKCALATGLTNGLALGSTEFHVFRPKQDILGKFLFTFLNRATIRKEAEQNMTGASGHRRVPASFYESYKIPLPPLPDQSRIVGEIEALEAQQNRLKAILQGQASQKQAVLKRYL